MLPRLLLPHVNNIACLHSEARPIHQREGAPVVGHTFLRLRLPISDVLPTSSSRQLESKYYILLCDGKAGMVFRLVLSDKLDE